MQTYINNDQDVQTFAGMLDALALLPVNDIIPGIAFLRENMHPDPRAVELVNYFDNTYVSSVVSQQLPTQNRPVRRNPPLFPPALWNVHTATLNDDPRTNNVCES